MAWPFNKVGNMSYYEHEVVGHPDVELGLCGERQVRYRIHGAEQAGSGLVVYIPGFGGDLGAYSQVFARRWPRSTVWLHFVSTISACVRARRWGRHLLAARGA